MILDFPSVKIPDFLTQLCSQNMTNTRQGHGQVFDLIQKDPFLLHYMKAVFKNMKPDLDMMSVISTLGIQGVRNYIGQAYLTHAAAGKFVDFIELDEIYDVLDFEKRYDFLFSEGNHRVFLLGYYLKLCDLKSNKNHEAQSFLSIPVEVDEVLSLGKSKNNDPDWLIMSIWLIISGHNKEVAKTCIDKMNQDFSEMISPIGEAFYEQMITAFLKYGYAIKDNSFFTEERI